MDGEDEFLRDGEHGESQKSDTGGQEECLEQERDHKKRKKVLHVLLILCGTLFLVTAGCLAGFLIMRAQGERDLKTKVPAVTDKAVQESGKAQDGIFIRYKGKEYRYNSDIINFLCLGIDKDIAMEEKRPTGSEGLSDVIMLVSVNTKNSQVKIIAVPRETMVPVRVLDKAGNFVQTEKKQITIQYAYGRTARDSCELMVDSVSRLLYQVPIQRYCAINFQALPVLNDAIGGVDLVALETVEWYAGSFYEGEELHLEGQAALDYVRQREEWVPKSSMGRLEREKQYINCYLEQAKDAVRKDMTLPVKLYQGLTENMCTNVTAQDITYLVPKLLDVSVTGEDICMVPGEVVTGTEHEEYHVQADALKELVIQSFYEEVSGED